MLNPRNMQHVVLAGLMGAISLTSARADTNSSFRPLDAHRLIGMKVEDRDGQATGKLWDLALDPQSGRLKYVIIASGGVLGVRPKLRAVPPEALSAETAKRGTLALTVIRAQFNRAPTVKRSEIAALGREDRAARIVQSFERSSPETEIAGTRGSLAPTGNRTGTRASNAPLKLAGDIIGKRVVNRQHEKIGEVLDLLVDFSTETPVFAIVSPGKRFKARGHHYVVPLRALRPTDDSGQWMIDATAASLAEARPFNWQSVPSDTAIYRFQERERGGRRGMP